MIKRVMDFITSMPEQGMSVSLVWHWHVRARSSPDQAYGAQPAREANLDVSQMLGNIKLQLNTNLSLAEP